MTYRDQPGPFVWAQAKLTGTEMPLRELCPFPASERKRAFGSPRPIFGRFLNPPLPLDYLAIRAETAAVVDHVGRFLKSDQLVSDLPFFGGMDLKSLDLAHQF